MFWEELSKFAKVAVIILVIFAILALGGLIIEAVFYPTSLSIQRSGVEHSKSYIDSRNMALSNLIREYNGNQTSETQKAAILGQMCQMASSMEPETVSANVNQFLVYHGGCQ
jgi:hypothetical protein